MANLINNVWNKIVAVMIGPIELIMNPLEKLWNFLVRHDKFVYLGLILSLVLPLLFK